MPNFIFDRNVYLAEGLTYRKVKRKIKKCRRFPYVFKLYVITAASNGKDQLDIVRTDMYFRKFYKDKDIRVYGFANDEVSAIELVKTITEECVNKTGGANLREYLKCLE